MTESKTSVALGSFDGLHKGHKAVTACALSEKERGLTPVILLFDSHPLLTLTGTAPKEILQKTLREEMLVKAGFIPYYISFSEIKDMTPPEFFEEILLNKLNAASLSCGWNYSFGKKGSGNPQILSELCAGHGVKLNILPHIDYNGSPVSSTAIRNAITEGRIAEANEMLGYEFRYRAVVKSGCQRGRLIGAPTINQYFDDGFIVPKNGVYASVTVIDGVDFPSVTNIGLRPTFENEDLRSETCIANFDGNLYGQDIEVHLIDYIRGEMRFNSAEELSNRIAVDADISKEKFRLRKYAGE